MAYISCLAPILLPAPAFGAGGVRERGGVAERPTGRPLLAPTPVTVPRTGAPVRLPPAPMLLDDVNGFKRSLTFLQQAMSALDTAVGFAGPAGLAAAGAVGISLAAGWVDGVGAGELPMSESDRGRHWPRHRSISSRRQVAAVTRSPALPAAMVCAEPSLRARTSASAVAITASACSEDGASGWRGEAQQAA